jgi:hypothetical protein
MQIRKKKLLLKNESIIYYSFFKDYLKNKTEKKKKDI